MLILNRRVGEAIRIDDHIRLVVLASDGNRVRLGIEAPASVEILREELVETIAEENRRAGDVSTMEEWLQILAQDRSGDRVGNRESPEAVAGEGEVPEADARS